MEHTSMEHTSMEHTSMEHKSEPVSGLVATVRSTARLRDGYYLSEELVDLYLLGVLRGAAIGLLDAEGPYGKDESRRRARLDELARTSAELLEHLNRLRPEPAQVSPAPPPRRPGDWVRLRDGGERAL